MELPQIHRLAGGLGGEPDPHHPCPNDPAAEGAVFKLHSRNLIGGLLWTTYPHCPHSCPPSLVTLSPTRSHLDPKANPPSWSLQFWDVWDIIFQVISLNAQAVLRGPLRTRVPAHVIEHNCDVLGTVQLTISIEFLIQIYQPKFDVKLGHWQNTKWRRNVNKTANLRHRSLI